jgi:cobalt/nickel transport system permease protein
MLVLSLGVIVLIRSMSPKRAHAPKENADHDHDHDHKHRHKLGHSHDTGVFSIDYYAYISAIRDWNPMFKVFFSLAVLIMVIAMDSLYISLFVLITMAFLTVVRGRIPLHQYISTLTIPIVFVLVGSLTIALSFARSPLGQYNLHLGFFYIYTSDADLLRMVNLMAKAMAAVSALFMMTLSTPSGEIISVMRKVHMPKLFVELMNMIYRYIFVIMETNRKMHDSAESRLGYVDYRTSIKSFSGTASNLLVVSLKKANAYYDALVSRGYDGELRFLEREKKLDREQIVLGVVYILCIALLFAMQKAKLFG